MEGRTSLKLIMEKGPREGETLKYSSGTLIKVGRVVRGNTIAIKDSGISSKHMHIQFDNQLSKWTLCDLDSSNGTFLNCQILKPFVHSVLADGDRIKIGELTSIIVKNEVESPVLPRRNLRRQGKSAAGSGGGDEPAAVVEDGKTELGLGFDGDLGKNEVKELVEKRNLRSGVRKAVDSRRILRSSKTEEMSLIPESLNVDVAVGEMVDFSVPMEPKRTRGRKKKMPDQLPVDTGLDQIKPANIVEPKRTRGRRKDLPVEPLENAQSSCLEEDLNNADESLQVDEGNKASFDKLEVDRLEKVKNSGLGDNLETNDESAQEHVVEKLVSSQECCEGKDVTAAESSLKGKEVAEESECMKDGCDNGRWLDLEKMTLGDFFDYLEVQLPKEIHEKSEKIISDLAEKARKCHEFRLQRNEHGKGTAVRMRLLSARPGRLIPKRSDIILMSMYCQLMYVDVVQYVRLNKERERAEIDTARSVSNCVNFSLRRCSV
ncbi:hypothetical protein L1987_65664 [Smallanthus sonchifolius]|uniref:Uncharacterized protein n=1 Tax=Smallanthus sonchifolius TaxID=185202 RepID=A0ACB9BV45_9ASTR|nr:hypothetical protein L1987_65664 [Smallanthus sonchifolius]